MQRRQVCVVASRAALRRGAREWSPYNRRRSGKSVNPLSAGRPILTHRIKGVSSYKCPTDR